MLKQLTAIAFCLAFLPSAAVAQDKIADSQKIILQNPKAVPESNDDWSGWWFLYHQDKDGKLVLDKSIKAMVIEDREFGLNTPITGQWIGCVWEAINKYELKKKFATLVFSVPGKEYTLRLTRTGVDEAEAIYLDAPSIRYIARRHKEHDECAGYAP